MFFVSIEVADPGALKTPLIMAVGPESCGAIKVTLSAIVDRRPCPDISPLVAGIGPGPLPALEIRCSGEFPLFRLQRQFSIRLPNSDRKPLKNLSLAVKFLEGIGRELTFSEGFGRSDGNLRKPLEAFRRK